MALFGLFGGERPAPNNPSEQAEGQDQAVVNPEGGVDLLNNATGGPAVAEAAPAQPQPSEEAAQVVVGEAVTNEPVSPAPTPAVTEAVMGSDADAEAVAASVDQQFAGAGFESSGQVVVQQPEAVPTADIEQPVAPVEPSLAEAPQMSDAALAPEQPAAQPETGNPEAI